MSRHHTIDYIEFSVLNLAESMTFFGTVFGWTFTKYGPRYAGIRGTDGEVGGLEESDEIPTGGPLVVIYSDDLEASLAAIPPAGGTIVRQPFGFPGGRRFHFTDPSGNEFAVWTQSPD